MKVLWCSNFSSQSGYSIQSRLFVPRIQQSGHEVVVFELSNGVRMPALRDGIKILPTGLDPLGSDMMHEHARREGVHAVISLIDAWGLNNGVMQGLNWFPWSPVDTQPIAPAVVNALKQARIPIAMSRYGEMELRKAGFDCFYMPHAIDPVIWHPRDPHACRQSIGISDDIFFASFVGVNDSVPSRKGIPELMIAWQIFSERHSDAILYLHTTRTGNLLLNNTCGVDIMALLKTFEIDERTVRFADEYELRTAFPADRMATIAAASDVLVLPTRGEGFGVPVLEYAAVGTPAIVTNFATSPELCFDGWLVEYEPEWSWQHAMVAKPGIVGIVEALEGAYADRHNPRRKQACIEGARNYHIDDVFAIYTVPMLTRMAEYVLDTVKAGA